MGAELISILLGQIKFIEDFFGEEGITIAGFGSLIALVSAAVSVIYMIQKNRAETKATLRTYEKEVQANLLADVADLREKAEKFIILRKTIIADPAIDHRSILMKIEEDYDLINPE